MDKAKFKEDLDELRIKEGCCCYCGRRMRKIKKHEYEFTIDHVIPKSNGGTNHPLNRLPCCRSCNHLKANNSLEYFLEQVQYRLVANIGGSKNSLKRWIHTANHISEIKNLIEKYKKEIFRYKVDRKCHLKTQKRESSIT